MEAQLWALQNIGVIVGSFLVGFIFFYVTSPFSRKSKKCVLDKLGNLLIFFVISIWIGKIVLNVNDFVQDPFAILAYPSDSSSFYFASVLTIFYVGWKVCQGRIKDLSMLMVFVPVFLTSSFTYEFIQMLWYDNTLSWMYIGFLTLLIVSYLLAFDKVTEWKLALALMALWCLGQLILSFMLPFATVFTYILSPWYLGIIFLVMIGSYLYLNRRLVS